MSGGITSVTRISESVFVGMIMIPISGNTNLPPAVGKLLDAKKGAVGDRAVTPDKAERPRATHTGAWASMKRFVSHRIEVMRTPAAARTDMKIAWAEKSVLRHLEGAIRCLEKGTSPRSDMLSLLAARSQLQVMQTAKLAAAGSDIDLANPHRLLEQAMRKMVSGAGDAPDLARVIDMLGSLAPSAVKKMEVSLNLLKIPIKDVEARKDAGQLSSLLRDMTDSAEVIFNNGFHGLRETTYDALSVHLGDLSREKRDALKHVLAEHALAKPPKFTMQFTALNYWSASENTATYLGNLTANLKNGFRLESGSSQEQAAIKQLSELEKSCRQAFGEDGLVDPPLQLKELVGGSIKAMIKGKTPEQIKTLLTPLVMGGLAGLPSNRSISEDRKVRFELEIKEKNDDNLTAFVSMIKFAAINAISNEGPSSPENMTGEEAKLAADLEVELAMNGLQASLQESRVEIELQQSRAKIEAELGKVFDLELDKVPETDLEIDMALKKLEESTRKAEIHLAYENALDLEMNKLLGPD
ncbi:MAG: hypothetical protein JWQ23_1865 [Herminiimonas sp.]|nr:hypothetical protein [Herminiimonas sp.]